MIDTVPPTKIQTIEITNFGGRLTRIINGNLNSGFAKFVPSFGYDPFSKPMNLTWLEAPVDISGSAITDLVLVSKQRFESGTQYIYSIGNTGRIYKTTPNTIGTPNLDTSSLLGTLSNHNMQFGASMEFYGATEKIYIGQDDRVNSVNFDGSGEATVGSTSSVMSNVARPLAQFVGKLIFGNQNNIGAIDSTATVTSYAQLSPALPPETHITDLDLSPDGNYLYITTSGTPNENITTVSNDRQAAAASDGNIYYWNGSDPGITASKSIPSYAVTALHTYLGNNVLFANDALGAGLNNGTEKMISLPNNKSSLPNANVANGNFLTWVNPEINATGTGIDASLYYFGNLDSENPSGLWRVMRYTTSLNAGFVYQTPLNIMTNNKYSTVNNAVTAVVSMGYGKHYFSAFSVNTSNTTVSATTAKLFRFLITSSGSGTPQTGVYETQNQLFSKKIGIAQIRVYCEPTATGNGFQLDVIGGDGNVVTNGTFTYSYGSVGDPNTNSSTMERINFNPNFQTLYSLGIRVTNTGSTNMTIKKIEVDYSEEGK